MDAMPAVEIVSPARDVVRDHRGTVIGRVEAQRLTGKLIARDSRGVLVGTYDPHSNETRNASGRLIGRGNVLGALLIVQGRL